MRVEQEPEAQPSPEQRAEARDEFCRRFRSRVSPTSLVWELGIVEPRAMRLGHHGEMLPGIPSISPAWGFFVDLAPGTAWPHRCVYVLLTLGGDAAWCPAEWWPQGQAP